MMLSRDWSRSCPDVDRYFGEKLERVVLLCGIFELTHLIGTEIDDALKLTRYSNAFFSASDIFCSTYLPAMQRLSRS